MKPMAHTSETRSPSLVASLEERAEVLRTPCGDGHMVWHAWGDGAPLFLLHGGYGSWKHWVRNIDALSQRYRVIAGDLPGLGASDPAPEPHTAEAIGRIVANAVGALTEDGERVFLAGFSLGSSISAQAMLALGARVVHTTVFGPSALGPYWQDTTGQLRRRSRTMSAAEIRDVVRQNLEVSMIQDPARIDDMAIDIQLELLDQKRQLIGMPISKGTALIEAIEQAPDRITVVFGEHDCYIAPDTATAAGRMRACFPELEVIVVPDAGHWVLYEAPKAVNEILIEAGRQAGL